MIDYDTLKDIMTDRAVLMSRLPPTFVKSWNMFQEISEVEYASGGKGIMAPVTLARGHTTGPKIPQHVARKYKPAIFNWKKAYTRVEIDGLANAVASKDPQRAAMAVTDLNNHINDAEQDWVHYHNRMIQGIGNGQLAEVAEDNGTDTIIKVQAFLSNPAWYPDDALKYVYQGQLIDIVHSGAVVNEDPLEVVSAYQDGDDYIIEVDAEVNAQDGDLVCHRDAYNAENIGLCGIVDDGTWVEEYGGISRDDYDYWKSTVLRGVGGEKVTLERGMLVNFWNRMKRRGMIRIDKILCDPEVITRYALLTTEYTRVFDKVPPNADAGFGGFVFTTPDGYVVPLEGDPHVPAGKMFWLAKGANFIHYAQQFMWKEGQSRYGGIFEDVTNTKDEDKLVATGAAYYTLFCNAPNQHGLIEDIDTSLPAGS